MSRSEQRGQAAEERELETIFSLATPRPTPPELVERRVREAVHAEWQRAVARKRARFTRIAAVAAVVLLTITGGLLLRPGASPNVIFEQARFLRVEGGGQLFRSGDAMALAASSTYDLKAGDRLRTSSDSGLTLDLGASGDLRLGDQTEVRLTGRETIRLVRGELFLATRSREGDKISVETAFGRVMHVGTRFQVILTDNELRVDVRDGVVLIDGQRITPTRTGAGTSARLDSKGNFRIEEQAPYGSSWGWVDQLAPPFEIDGRSVHAAALWAAEQSGRELEFSDSAVEREARTTTLHGDLVLEDPLTGLRDVMMTTRLQFALRNNRIYVSARQ